MQLLPVMHVVAHPFPCVLVLGLSIFFTSAAQAFDHSLGSAARQNEQAAAHHAHSATDDHMHMLSKRDYVRKVQSYPVPDISLIGTDGRSTSLARELTGEGPVMLNFIYSTCTTICPIMTTTFAQVRKQLGPERDKVRMVSITIDPEHDVPAKLREYAMKFRAGPGWRFLTGTPTAIIDAQKAFDVFRGDKANHIPVTFLRAAANAPWIRLEGLMSAADLVREYRQLTAQ